MERPDFRKMVKEFTEAMRDEMTTEMVSMAREAMGVMREVMMDPGTKPQHRLQAAKEVLERAGIQPEEKAKQVDIKNTHTYNVLSSVSDEDLNKIIEADFEEVVADDGK